MRLLRLAFFVVSLATASALAYRAGVTAGMKTGTELGYATGYDDAMAGKP